MDPICVAAASAVVAGSSAGAESSQPSSSAGSGERSRHFPEASTPKMDVASRALAYFEMRYPKDARP